VPVGRGRHPWPHTGSAAPSASTLDTATPRSGGAVGSGTELLGAGNGSGLLTLRGRSVPVLGGEDSLLQTELSLGPLLRGASSGGGGSSGGDSTVRHFSMFSQDEDGASVGVLKA
jgi:hypothetical protein